MHHDRTGTAGEKPSFCRTGMLGVDPSVQLIPFDTRSAVFDALHLGVFAIRRDGVLFETNQTLATMLGYANVEELLADSERPWGVSGDRRWWQQLRDRGAVHDVELRLRRRDGSFCWVSICAVMADRPSASAFGVVKDIEQRKRTEEALRRSETHYRKIVEMSPDAVAITRFDGEFVAINARFTDLFGFESVEELRSLGINSKGLIIERDDDKVQASGAALQLDVPYTTLTARVRRKDRSEFLAELSASLIRDDAGEPEAFLTLIRDVSVRKRVERALLESEAWLRETGPGRLHQGGGKGHGPRPRDGLWHRASARRRCLARERGRARYDIPDLPPHVSSDGVAALRGRSALPARCLEEASAHATKACETK